VVGMMGVGRAWGSLLFQEFSQCSLKVSFRAKTNYLAEQLTAAEA